VILAVGRFRPLQSAGMVTVSAVDKETPEVVAGIAGLLPLLSSSAAVPTASEIAEIATASATTLLIARDDETGSIVGTLTLVLFRIPSGVRAWIEDVIVATEVRGQGVGEALSRAALDVAAAAGARTVELTSRPSREAANRLYRKIGFKKGRPTCTATSFDRDPASAGGEGGVGYRLQQRDRCGSRPIFG